MATQFKVSCDDFRMLLKRLARFTAKDDTRPVLMAIRLEAKKDSLEGVAADGFILGCQRIDYTEPPESVGQLLVQAEPLLSALRTVPKTAALMVTFEDDTCSVETSGIDVSVPATAGKYPNIASLKPSAVLEGKTTTLNPDLLKLVNFGRAGLTMLHIQVNGGKGVVPVATNDGFWGLIMPMFVDEKRRSDLLAQAIVPKRAKAKAQTE